MPQEIERKYIVRSMPSVDGIVGKRIAQGYLSDSLPTVRVRIIGDQGFLTVKGPSKGIARAEFEYEIPLVDAEQLLTEHARYGRVDKTRYAIAQGKHTLELDVFHGVHEGLMLVELELENEQEQVEMPEWVGAEVSTDPDYYNSNIAKSVILDGRLKRLQQYNRSA